MDAVFSKRIESERVRQDVDDQGLEQTAVPT